MKSVMIHQTLRKSKMKPMYLITFFVVIYGFAVGMAISIHLDEMEKDNQIMQEFING